MIPAAFDYHAPSTLREAVAIMRRAGGDARVLAGGMSLVPMMKLRLANPTSVVDLSRVGGLTSLTQADGALHIGAMTTHHALESSTLVAERVPLLAEAAAMVGDLQVRNRGTIGGSIAHADPAADLPAVMLACEARFHTVGGTRHRTIRAERMFVDAYTTALGETEILTLIEVPVTRARTGCSYQKLANKASRFAVVGVAVLVTLDADGGCERVRIGVTGAGPAASRARAAERSLTARTPTSENVATAAKRASRGIECLSDVHGSAEYREHLVGELTRRALTEAAARAARA